MASPQNFLICHLHLPYLPISKTNRNGSAFPPKSSPQKPTLTPRSSDRARLTISQDRLANPRRLYTIPLVQHPPAVAAAGNTFHHTLAKPSVLRTPRASSGMIRYVRADPSARTAVAPFRRRRRAPLGRTPPPDSRDSGFEEANTKSTPSRDFGDGLGMWSWSA